MLRLSEESSRRRRRNRGREVSEALSEKDVD